MPGVSKASIPRYDSSRALVHEKITKTSYTISSPCQYFLAKKTDVNAAHPMPKRFICVHQRKSVAESILAFLPVPCD
jgi:hypothetical protein